MTPSFDQLVNHLSKLPSIGKKTAQRLAIYIFKQNESFSHQFAQSLIDLKAKTKYCEQCFNISENTLCDICANQKRDQTILCVVSDFFDILAIEKTNEFNGQYHVLGGVLSPLDGIGPSHLRIVELDERLESGVIQEVIFALPPNTEGEATSTFISNMISKHKINITKIARGVPIGSQLEFVDQVTLGRAISSRRGLD